MDGRGDGRMEGWREDGRMDKTARWIVWGWHGKESSEGKGAEHINGFRSFGAEETTGMARPFLSFFCFFHPCLAFSFFSFSASFWVLLFCLLQVSHAGLSHTHTQSIRPFYSGPTAMGITAARATEKRTEEGGEGRDCRTQPNTAIVTLRFHSIASPDAVKKHG